jgi:hypothetical protein
MMARVALMNSFLLIFLAAAVANAAPQPFNILFAISDDHSLPHLGCYGGLVQAVIQKAF